MNLYPLLMAAAATGLTAITLVAQCVEDIPGDGAALRECPTGVRECGDLEHSRPYCAMRQRGGEVNGQCFRERGDAQRDLNWYAARPRLNWVPLGVYLRCPTRTERPDPRVEGRRLWLQESTRLADSWLEDLAATVASIRQLPIVPGGNTQSYIEEVIRAQDRVRSLRIALGSATENASDSFFRSLEQQMEEMREYVNGVQAREIQVAGRVSQLQRDEEARRLEEEARRRVEEDRRREEERARREREAARQTLRDTRDDLTSSASDLSEVDVGNGYLGGHLSFGMGLYLFDRNTPLEDELEGSAPGLALTGALRTMTRISSDQVWVDLRAHGGYASGATSWYGAASETAVGTTGTSFQRFYAQGDALLWIGPVALGPSYFYEQMRAKLEDTQAEVEESQQQFLGTAAIGMHGLESGFTLSASMAPPQDSTALMIGRAEVYMGMLSLQVSYLRRTHDDPASPVSNASDLVFSGSVRLPW